MTLPALQDSETVFASSTAGAYRGPKQAVGLNRKVLQLTSAQILALETTAVQVLEAPGPGFMIVPLHIIIDMQAGSAAYLDGGGGAVSFSVGSWSQALAANTVFLAAIGDQNHQIVNFAALATAAAPPTNENAPLNISKATANFTAGNGVAQVVVYYTIEPIVPPTI
jgi:hypothetical protein